MEFQMSKSSKIAALTIFAATTLIVGACSSQAPGTKPDDMSAEEHQQHAKQHQKTSEEHQEQYKSGARATREEVPVDPEKDFYSVELYNPTEHHQTSADQHKRHAEQHRQAAQTLLSYEQAQCAQFPKETRSSCPLMGQIKAVEDVDGGARITFHEGVPMQATVDHMKCHFAFARAQGYGGMKSCPLYLEGVSVEADGQSVTLTTDKPEAVEPLRKRSREHVTQ
jgi:hypothetical protein